MVHRVPAGVPVGGAVRAGGGSNERRDYALITRQDGYELRFRTVELWGELLESEEHGWIAAGDE